MKIENIIAVLSIAGIAFALWDWKPQQERIGNDSQNLSGDWFALGNDIRTSMRYYDQKSR